MIASEIALVLLVIAVLVAVLGGLGVAGMGVDSRHLDGRGQPGENTGRSLTS